MLQPPPGVRMIQPPPEVLLLQPPQKYYCYSPPGSILLVYPLAAIRCTPGLDEVRCRCTPGLDEVRCRCIPGVDEVRYYNADASPGEGAVTENEHTAVSGFPGCGWPAHMYQATRGTPVPGYTWYSRAATVWLDRQGEWLRWVLGAGISRDQGIWTMGFGLWVLDYRVWTMVFGLWCLDYGVWTMVFGLWGLDYGVWTMVFGLWCLDYGVWTMGFGLWRPGWHPDLLLRCHECRCDSFYFVHKVLGLQI